MRIKPSLTVALVLGAFLGQAHAEEAPPVVASLSTEKRFVLPNQPCYVEFAITNPTDEPVELAVPGTKPLPSVGMVGLPLAHVFSGPGYVGLKISGGPMSRTWDVPQQYQPPAAAETLVLAPHASVGITLDVSEFYPVLRTPGKFRLKWTPYGGGVVSNDLVIEVAARKQVLLQTDYGTMTVRFFYDVAPNHVANFLELTRDGFYDNLLIRVVPGYYIQSGCANGDGTGIRPDGVKLDAELSDLPIERGSLVMARLEEDLDSASSQFLITATRVPQWDGRYTVFGEIVGEDSFLTLDRLMDEPVAHDGWPLDPLYMRSVRVIDAPPTRSNPNLSNRQPSGIALP